MQLLGTAPFAIKVDLAEPKIKAHVVPEEIQDVPVIVSQPFTDLPNVMVVQKGDLRLFDTEKKALPGLDKLSPIKLEVWARDATVIPPGEAANVKFNRSADCKSGMYL